LNEPKKEKEKFLEIIKNIFVDFFIFYKTKNENNLNKFNIRQISETSHISKMSQQVEAKKFHDKINQLMTLIINAFYANKEIFI
jgi:hypothetical protein